MVYRGHLRNGVIVLDDSVLAAIPDGTPVTVEIPTVPVDGSTITSQVRQGGQWRHQVRIADDFDQLPTDLAEAFGVNGS